MNQYIHWVDFIVTRLHSLAELSDSEEIAFTNSWSRLQNHQVPFSSKLTDLEENESVHSLSRLHCHQVPFSCKLSASEEAASTHSWDEASKSPGSIFLQTDWFGGKMNQYIHWVDFIVTRLHSLATYMILKKFLLRMHGTGFKITRFHFRLN